jgi:hypothetical protein
VVFFTRTGQKHSLKILAEILRDFTGNGVKQGATPALGAQLKPTTSKAVK